MWKELTGASMPYSLMTMPGLGGNVSLKLWLELPIWLTVWMGTSGL